MSTNISVMIVILLPINEAFVFQRSTYAYMKDGVFFFLIAKAIMWATSHSAQEFVMVAPGPKALIPSGCWPLKNPFGMSTHPHSPLDARTYAKLFRKTYTAPLARFARDDCLPKYELSRYPCDHGNGIPGLLRTYSRKQETR